MFEIIALVFVFNSCVLYSVKMAVGSDDGFFLKLVVIISFYDYFGTFNIFFHHTFPHFYIILIH